MRLRLMLVTASSVLLAIGTGCAPQDTGAAEIQAIKTKSGQWSKDLATKDAAKFASYYDDDAYLLLPGEPIVHGAGNIKAAVGPMMQDPNFAMSFATDKVDVSGSLAYSQGPYSMTTTAKGGKPVTDKGKYLTVWKKQADGSWKAIEDMLNSDIPPQ